MAISIYNGTKNKRNSLVGIILTSGSDYGSKEFDPCTVHRGYMIITDVVMQIFMIGNMMDIL